MNRIAGFAIILILIAACYVQAQNDTQPLIVITGHPYSLRQTITVTRPDGGSTIVSHLKWRDDQGRTRQEQIQRTPEGSETRIINVSDPVARQQLSWQVGPRIEKEVFATPISDSVQAIDHMPGSDMTPAQRSQAIARKRNPNVTGERLGLATINGVKATGLRTITVIPAGAEGNEHERKIVHESWRSIEREDLIVRSITEDSRTGTTDSELTEINFSDPDPSLFEPPPNYRVQVVSPR